MNILRPAAAATLVLALAGGCSEDRGGGAGDAGPATQSSTDTLRADRDSPGSGARSLLPGPLAAGPVRATSARQLAAQLVAAEDAIADRRTPPRVLALAARVQQLAYRVLGGKPAWDARVRAALPARLRGVVDRNVRARREFRSMHQQPGDTLPAWRIVPPVPAPTLKRHYREAELRFGVPWEYLAAINLVETAMGRIRGTSTAGAQGPMQFIPTTWDAYGRGDVNDPRDAILAAGRYLQAMGFARDPAGALYRYNNSSAYVRGVTEHARVMQERPRAFLGYHGWDVYFVTTRGDVRLPVGYVARRPVPVDDWLADHPQP